MLDNPKGTRRTREIRSCIASLRLEDARRGNARRRGRTAGTVCQVSNQGSAAKIKIAESMATVYGHVLSGHFKAEFGKAITAVPLLGGQGRDAIVIGSPQSDVGGVAKTGGAFIFRHRPDGAGFDPTPVAIISGETYRKGGVVGNNLDATLLDGVPTVVVAGSNGTPYASDELVDNGTVYTFQFPIAD